MHDNCTDEAKAFHGYLNIWDAFWVVSKKLNKIRFSCEHLTNVIWKCWKHAEKKMLFDDSLMDFMRRENF